MQAVERARPEVVIHQATAIPPVVTPRRIARDFVSTNRLRTEGTDHLLAAARAAGARRFIAQSFGGYLWSPRPGPPVREEEPRAPQPPGPLKEILAALDYLERVVPAAQGIEGVVLRYGGFYGPGTQLARDGATVAQLRQRQFPVVGGGVGVWSFVHIEDAARATVLALERGSPGVYNVADDEPAAVSVWLPYLAECIGAPAPWRVPGWIGRLLAGEAAVTLMTQVRGIDNAKARRELRWNPRWPTWREGFRRGLI
jgi:nucleoside-diphosphate-sugar epimerase